MAVATVHSDFGTQENKICYCFHFFPICLPWSDGTSGSTKSMILVFWMLSYKPAFSLSSFPSSRSSLAPLHFLPFSLVQFNHSVMSDSLRPHESQHARPPCPSQTPRVYSNSCPSSQLCLPTISSSVFPLFLLPPTTPSIRVFFNESTLRMRWPKYWSFSFSISPSNEHPGLISFRMDWLDLLAVQ